MAAKVSAMLHRAGQFCPWRQYLVGLIGSFAVLVIPVSSSRVRVRQSEGFTYSAYAQLQRDLK